MDNPTTQLNIPWLRSVATTSQQLYDALRPRPYPSIPLRTQLLLAVMAAAIGTLFGLIRLILRVETNDLWLAYGSAQLLWQGQNPYAYPTGGWPSNPLPTVLAMMPFTVFSLEYVGAGLVAIITALLIFGAFHSGQPLRLWALASWPFCYNLLYAQWGILFLAILLLPHLAWLTPIKPQLGLSVFFSRFQWKQVLFAGLFLLLSLLIAPSWPALWLEQVGGYDGFMPMTFFPIILLVPLIIWRRGITAHRVVFYVLFCLSPQRLWHDQLLLWYIPRRGWQIALITAASWLSLLSMESTAFAWNWVTLLSLFVPCGLFLLFERADDE